MITCEKCKLILDDGTDYCPRCGDALSGPGSASVEDQEASNVHSLLAAANLCRVRGEWDEAIELCMQALKIEPKNAEVYSLLGDIYELRGQDEEAAQWFAMALDLKPTNKTDRIKLDKLREKLAKLEAGQLPSPSDGSASWLDRFVEGKGMDTSVRIITVASVVFVALLLVLGVFAFLTYTPTEDIEISGIRPIDGVHDSDIEPFNHNEHSVPVPPAALRSPAEHQLLANISQDSRVRGRNAAIDDVKVDPRIGLVMVTFSTSAALTKASIVVDALSVAGAAFAGSPGSTWVMVRCYGNITNQAGVLAPDLLFVADIERNVAAAADVSAPLNSNMQLFVNTWWNPRLQ